MNFDDDVSRTRVRLPPGPQRMYKVYVVGVMQLDLTETKRFPAERKTRLWHFFARFEDAEKCVLYNQNDIFESYYNIALIEEHYVYDPEDKPDVDFTSWLSAKQWWYKADHRLDEEGRYIGKVAVTKIEPPQIFRNIVNFWAG